MSHTLTCAALFLAIVLAAGQTAAQEIPEEPAGIQIGEAVLLVPNGQYRPRYLAHGGLDFKPGNTYDAFSHRARLGLEARVLTWFSAMIQLQDVRRWGEETSTLADFSADGFGVHQAWAEARTPLGLEIRLGRQEITLDNQRLVGAVGWADQARAFDAIKLTYRLGEAFKLIAFYAKTGEEDAFLQGTDPKGDPLILRGSEEDTDLAGLWVRYTPVSWMRPSLTLLYDWQGPSNQNRVTLGTFVDCAPIYGVTYSGELYLQLGRRGPDADRQQITAFMGAIRLGYKAPLPASPSVTAWFEYLSGDDDPKDDTVRTFDTLFATNHKFYGFMDFFLNIPKHTAGYGLIDAGGRLKVQPLDGLVAWIDWHHFEFAKKHSTGATTLGNELDLLVGYSLNKYVALQAVFGAFFPKLGGSLLRGNGYDNESTEVWGYLQTDLKF